MSSNEDFFFRAVHRAGKSQCLSIPRAGCWIDGERSQPRRITGPASKACSAESTVEVFVEFFFFSLMRKMGGRCEEFQVRAGLGSGGWRGLDSPWVLVLVGNDTCDAHG